MYKIIKKLINNSLNGVDVYYHNGGIWFIFTETKQWVLEIEKSGNLWYSYSFFKNLFNYLSMDVVENQEYITRYVEDVLQNGVKNTKGTKHITMVGVEDVLQNGVKNTTVDYVTVRDFVEDVLQNGVKNTESIEWSNVEIVEDVLQSGIKRTISVDLRKTKHVEDAIQNGEKL